ncbi:hypothetical protein HYDPIDRAFT_169981 [Hydnomerulius pinastri MD-312]|uniref:Unplaced genomic scaffold scaffold_33, whole genome shotgun sequence n=1 Tax=Hydnomerulius pinastri MD-312 TaxID=994086 RepID=A0A0C9WB83_9AGAM|nr:hypothetical protein HYDPIDRAFT_169981 [Hydnomerulius pinastri MD-312]
MGKRKRLSTVSAVRESYVTPSGASKSRKANLTQVAQDRLAFEEEKCASEQCITSSARLLLAEAMLNAGKATTNGHNDKFDYSLGSGDFSGTTSLNEDPVQDDNQGSEAEDSDEDLIAAGQDCVAMNVTRAQIIVSLQGCHRRWPRAPHSRLQRNREAHLAWTNQMTPLVDTYLQWKHTSQCGPEVHVDADMDMTTFEVMAVGISSFIPSQQVYQHVDQLANVSLLSIGYLGCSPLQPVAAISLQCLELYHQIHCRKPSFSVQVMVKVICALHNVC